jgi:phage-related protein
VSTQSSGPARESVWQFFRASTNGRPIFKKELDNLPRDARAAMTNLMRRYLLGQLRPGDIKPIHDGISELRWRDGNDHYRVLFFRWDCHPVALTAFFKSQQRTPKSRIELAKKRRKTWTEAFGSSPTD